MYGLCRLTLLGASTNWSADSSAIFCGHTNPGASSTAACSTATALGKHARRYR